MGQDKQDRITAKQRREEILNYLQTVGAFSVNREKVQEWALQFKCSERRIYININEVLEEVAMPQLESLSKKFALSFERAMRVSHLLMTSPKEETRAKGVALLNDTIANFTDFLEKFGYKAKVAEKHEITGKLLQLEFITHVTHDGNKKDNSGTKPEATEGLGIVERQDTH